MAKSTLDIRDLNLYLVYFSVIGLASPPATREQTVPENNRPHGLHTGTSSGFFLRQDIYLTSLNQIISLFNLAK